MQIPTDQAQPIDIQIIFMRNWDPLLSESSPTPPSSEFNYNYTNPTSTGQPNMSPCEWKQDWEDVQNVARHVGVPEARVKMVDLSSEYWGRVFEPSLRVWEEGGTPNPDVGCNRFVIDVFSPKETLILLGRSSLALCWTTYLIHLVPSSLQVCVIFVHRHKPLTP
jgi:hypothetical protein